MPSTQPSDLTRILIVEDQPSMQQLVEDYLRPNGFETQCCNSADEAMLKMGIANDANENGGSGIDKQLGFENAKTQSDSSGGESNFDVVLTDVKMPGTDGLEFCRRVKQRFPSLPVIVMTAYGSLETAVEALRAGAFDFVTKPVELELLKASLVRAAENSQLRRRVRLLESQVQTEFPELIGQSDVMLRLKDQLSRIVDSSAAVLLTGESGSGKEVVARALHQQSTRSDKPFVAVNCAALPEALLESELFGHVKGAFTDAKEDRVGLFLQANGGTLFLDEIGEMPIEVQPKLLRALEQKTVRPVGGKSEQPFDVHLIAATNRDLETAIESKTFREDLYYRINVLEISAPPLRTRGTDVLVLAEHFLKEFVAQAGKAVTGFEDQVSEKLLSYDWPGNVRELRNVIQRAVVLSQHEKITTEVLPQKVVDHKPSKLVIDEGDNQPLASLDVIEMRYIRYVLDRVDGNKTEAAKVLGLDRKTLYRKLKD